MTDRRETTAIGPILIAALLGLGAQTAAACTAMTFRAEDGTGAYARTMEWGASDLKSELVLVARGTAFTADLGAGAAGMAWTNVQGFVGVNAAGLPYATDGMNEAGLTVGLLFFPGFAEYQASDPAAQARTITNIDVGNYILGNFADVGAVRAAFADLRVVHNAEIEKEFGTPLPLHYIVTDATGASIVIEYTASGLAIYDNTVGAMTNAPAYDWHLLNLRNYANLRAFDDPAGREIAGLSLAPFGVGSGMVGLPGDFTPPSRFIRAAAFVITMAPVADAAAAVSAASTMLDNFDIPRGLVREGASPEEYHLGYTQWSVIADTRNRVYHYWTMYDRRMRSVDLGRIDFAAATPAAFPLDRVRTEDIEDRTAEFLP